MNENQFQPEIGPKKEKEENTKDKKIYFNTRGEMETETEHKEIIEKKEQGPEKMEV